MSRNVRNKSSAAARKAAKRRDSITSSSSFNLSDDEGYSAVEDISDSSDDDEEDVVAAEEEHILHEALPPSISSSPRPPIVQEEDEEDDDDDDDQEPEEEDEEEEDGAADVEDSASWDGIMSDVDESAASDHHHRSEPMERHVRFDVPSSDSDSTDTEDDHADFFPDIFVDQSSLDPAFRREIENDDENDESEASNSFWDYHGDSYGGYEYGPGADSDIEAVIQELGDDDTPIATPMTTGGISEVPTPVAAFEETQELDGYETDGDTTEEDEPEPVVRRKIKRPEQPAEWDDSDTDHPVKGERGQPRVGRFNLDSSERKPIAVVNPISRKMMIFTPHRRRHLDLSPEQFNFSYLAPIDENQNSPMLSNSAQIMMSAMFSSNTFGDYLNTQAMGPAEAFFPFQSEPNTADESSEIEIEDEDEIERSLDINDFIEFDDTRSLDGDDENQWDADPLNSTPARPRSSSDVDLHSHINANNVGAFRRDQINQRLILSDKATQDSLALSSPYNYTALRGLKSDRFETAAVPLTPLRRSKKQMRDVTRSPLESMSQKRKASSEMPMVHKRQRSISDVNLLRI